MPTLNYAAPATVDEAVKLLAGSSGLAKVLSGGTDLLVQLRSGRLKPELIVDTKKIPGIIGIREENGSFIIGAATPGAIVEAHAGMNKAWPGVVEALDLIGSTQIQGRCFAGGQPVQCLAGRRQRAGAVRGGRDRRGGRRQGTPRGAGGADPHRTRPHLARQGRVHPGVQAAAAAAALERCLPALHSAHRDGHRRGRLRHQRDAGRQGRVHRGARVARRGGADGAAGQGSRRCADRAHARRRHAGEAGRGGARGVQADRRQARNDRLPHQGGRRAGPPCGGDRIRSRGDTGKTQGKTH